MKTISKITVQPFLNTSLRKNSACIIDSDGNEVRTYPLYYKIIFMRKTTQLKSIFNREYFDKDSQMIKDANYIALEKKMVEDVVEREFLKNPEKFSLIGIADKCKFYAESISETLIDNYIWNEFKKTIMRSDSEYKRILLNRSSKEKVSTYFKAALVLVDRKPELVKLEGRFKNVENFESICKPMINLNKTTLLDWKFNRVKEEFVQIALKKKYNLDEINEYVSIIDKVIKTKE